MKRVVSLATGYGGLDMAVQAVWPDARTVTVSDIDPAVCRFLACRHPRVPNVGNVMTVDWSRYPIAHRPHILTAGYPCQPFSSAGKKKGFDDERNVWPGVLRAIRTLRPRLVLLENVRGHLRLGFDQVLWDLAEAGFDAEWGVYRASDVGAPHRRERLFIAAWGPDTDGTGLEGRPALPERARELAAGSLGVAVRGSRYQDAAHATRPNGGETQLERVEAPAGPAAELGERSGTDWGPYAAAVRRWELILGRTAPIPHDGKRVAPEFVEWMMGLPEGWVTGPLPTYVGKLSRTHKLKMLGNGAVPQQAAHAIRDLIGV